MNVTTLKSTLLKAYLVRVVMVNRAAVYQVSLVEQWLILVALFQAKMDKCGEIAFSGETSGECAHNWLTGMEELPADEGIGQLGQIILRQCKIGKREATSMVGVRDGLCRTSAFIVLDRPNTTIRSMERLIRKEEIVGCSGMVSTDLASFWKWMNWESL